METVIVYELDGYVSNPPFSLDLDKYGWKCRKCGEWNTSNNDPREDDIIICSKCSKEFEIEFFKPYLTKGEN